MSAPSTIRLVIVDDHDVVRRGLRAFLETEPGFEVVGEAADGEEAIERAREARPDVVLMDLVMPRLDGVSATRRLHREMPDIKVLVVTSFGSDDKLFPALRAGAVGYLLKDATPAQLADAIRRAASGSSALDPVVARRLLREIAHEPAETSPREELTGREIEVLRVVARGADNAHIAGTLGISEATVRTHVSAILRKLALSNRTQAALYALREGLVALDEL